MFTATKEEKLNWCKTIVSTNSASELLAVVEGIWNDGYKSAEAEITYKIIGEK